MSDTRAMYTHITSVSVSYTQHDESHSIYIGSCSCNEWRFTSIDWHDVTNKAMNHELSKLHLNIALWNTN